MTHAAPDHTGDAVADLLDLSDRVAVVTGAARGIGRAIASRLVEAGAIVVVSDIDDAAAESTAHDLARTTHRHVHSRTVDVRDRASVEALAAFADELGGGIRIWVNNAGIFPSAQFTSMTDDEWDRVHGVDLRGAFLGSRAAAARMSARRGERGRVIINVTSMAGFGGRANLAHYSAAKHGVVGLIKSLAIELGPEGIRSVGIAPSLIVTPGQQARRTGASADIVADLDEFEEKLATANPMGRIGVPDDVARVALYLASDMSEYINGVTIPVDGGVSAG